MATIEDAEQIAVSLPEVTEGLRHGHRTWFVRGKAFAWQRPFSKADIRRFGQTPPPDGPILAVIVADLEDKDAVLESASRSVFNIAHFDGFAAVLVQVRTVKKRELKALLEDAWIAGAPAELRRR